MSDYQTIEKAILYIQSEKLNQPTLDEVANSVGLSTSHFQRLFSRWAGISPKRFLQTLTLEDAVSQICNKRGESLLEVSHRVGLSSSSRLYEHFVQLTAMTPGEYKRGGAEIQIRFGEALSKFGLVFIAWTDRGVCKISFADHESELNNYIHELKTEWPHANYLRNDAAAESFVERIFESEKNVKQPLSLFVKGTNFQINVWRALLSIPQGQLSTYQQISNLIDKPKAARAVGTAIGANPLAYIIPCHRVIRQSGGLGGYRWGLARKQSLLAYELSQKN